MKERSQVEVWNPNPFLPVPPQSQPVKNSAICMNCSQVRGTPRFLAVFLLVLGLVLGVLQRVLAVVEHGDVAIDRHGDRLAAEFGIEDAVAVGDVVEEFLSLVLRDQVVERRR